MLIADAGLDEVQAMRAQLTQRINASRQPSLLINRLVVADLRCAESARSLSRLILKAPRIVRAVRAELRKAFDLDPNNLIFTEPKPPALAQKIDTLTDRALRLLVWPSVSININQFTALSLKDNPTARLPFTPLEALRRVAALNLLVRLTQVHGDYWQALVPGSWLTRKERWVEVYQQMFADQAFLSRQLNELSSAGFLMVQALVDAPTAEARQRAGGQWAEVRVSELMWPGTGPRLTPIPGALHIYREGDPADAPHVMYLPGVNRNFYEYASFAQLQCGLVALINGALFDDLWQCLPLRRRHELCVPDDKGVLVAPAVMRGLALRGDALALSAHAVLDGQWENELACAVSVNLEQVFFNRRAPSVTNTVSFLAHIERARRHWIGKARLGTIRRELRDWDQQRRCKEIIFASTSPTLAVNTIQGQVKRYEKALMTLLDPQDPGEDTQAFRDFVALEGQCKAHADTLRTLLHGAQLQLFDAVFWKARPNCEHMRLATAVDTWAARLRCDVQLHHALKLIRTPHRDLLLEVLDKPLASKRAGSQTCVLSVLVGSETGAFLPLHSLFVVTRTLAITEPGRRLPVVLCAFGREGGLVTYASLGALTGGIKASLGSRDESVLWRYVSRQNREDLRGHAVSQTLEVRYEPIEGNPVRLAFKRLLKGYKALASSIDDMASIFGEIDDPHLKRLLLAVELEEHLTAPANVALAQGRFHFDLVRTAVGVKRRLPRWLAEATPGQLSRFKHEQRLFLGNVLALEARREQRLPDLYTFARGLLIARLRKDGLSQLMDIDTPFIEMPDQVAGRFCGWESTCPVGDRSEILTPSTERTRFSLLRLALHNLDPQMKATWWRFKYASYLKPAWKKQLSPQYLVSMVYALDIGGQYTALIDAFFYPPDGGGRGLSDGRGPELLRRVLGSGADANLYSAVQQGLTAEGQGQFTTAMMARTPQDLRKQGYQLQLYVVHLVGHTLQHDRYIGGIVVVHDLLSQRCVIYWPAAPDAMSISEFNSLELAREYLNRIGALPEHVSALARDVAPGWAFEAITHFPGETRHEPTANPLYLMSGFQMLHGIWRGADFIRSFNVKHLVATAHLEEIEKQTLEQIASDPLNWLALVPTSHCDARALLFRARVSALHRQAQTVSNSSKTLDQYREGRLKQERDTRDRAVLSVFSPLSSLFNSLYELLLTARRYHRFGDARDAVAVAFGTIYLVVEIFSTVMPGPKKVAALARSGMRSMSAGLKKIHVSNLSAYGRVVLSPPSLSTVSRLKVLERFRVKGVPEGAVALKGPGETGIYVRAGERFIVDGSHHTPIYRRDGENGFRLKNKDVPGQDELILNIYEPKDVLLGADAPVAGPSSGALNPWRAPVPQVDWRPPITRTATESRILQSSTTASHWLDWRTAPPAGQPLTPIGTEVFRIAEDSQGFSKNVLRVAPPNTSLTDPLSGYYKMLPDGGGEPTNIHFIHRDEPLVSLAHVDIDRWTNTAPLEQPVPVSYSPTGWTLHARLFDRPLEQSVGAAFPTLTPASRRFAAIRLVELADPSRVATASHLLNIRATLDDWLPPPPRKLGQTDDLLRMLRPTDRGGRSIYIGFDGKAPGFTRVDFVAHGLDLALRSGGRGVALQREITQRLAIRRVLEEQGFTVQDLQVRRQGYPAHDMVATHALSNSNNVYYLSLHWRGGGGLQLSAKLTDKWLKGTIKQNPGVAPLAQVNQAMIDNRLILIVAGIQWPNKGTVPASVYFVKVSRS